MVANYGNAASGIDDMSKLDNYYQNCPFPKPKTTKSMAGKTRSTGDVSIAEKEMQKDMKCSLELIDKYLLITSFR